MLFIFKEGQVYINYETHFEVIIGDIIIALPKSATLYIQYQKSAIKDPHVHLNSKGTSLLSCLLRTSFWTRILTKRICDHCEMHDICMSSKRFKTCIDDIPMPPYEGYSRQHGE